MKRYVKAILEEEKLYARIGKKGSLTFFVETPFDDLVRLTNDHMIETAGYIPRISDVELKHIIDGFYSVKINKIRRPMQHDI